MLYILFDRLLARWQRRGLPDWFRKPDPLLPRLRPSYRWWVRY